MGKHKQRVADLEENGKRLVHMSTMADDGQVEMLLPYENMLVSLVAAMDMGCEVEVRWARPDEQNEAGFEATMSYRDGDDSEAK